MDFFDFSPSTSSPSPFLASPPPPRSTRARTRGGIRSVVSHLVGRFLCAVVTCVFALVGSFVGAVTGALIGLATESGLFRGAGIGAISGAVFSIEVVESSLALWHSNESGIWSILYVIDIITSLLSGRLVREKVGPAVQSAVQSQMNAVDLPFVEAIDLFETGGTRGMSKDLVDKIPKISVTAENNVDDSGEKICCSVCLQDLQIGETVRSLPHCQHMFHLLCIDSWLIRHGSCPLCRRDI
ncbi:putative transcription factor C2H2 family [Dioscorea sansibarensis]